MEDLLSSSKKRQRTNKKKHPELAAGQWSYVMVLQHKEDAIFVKEVASGRMVFGPFKKVHMPGHLCQLLKDEYQFHEQRAVLIAWDNKEFT